MTKTNKSFTKRLRVTKKGKVMAQKPGRNHFNAKSSRKNIMKKKRTTKLSLSGKARSRFLPGRSGKR